MTDKTDEMTEDEKRLHDEIREDRRRADRLWREREEERKRKKREAAQRQREAAQRQEERERQEAEERAAAATAELERRKKARREWVERVDEVRGRLSDLQHSAIPEAHQTFKAGVIEDLPDGDRAALWARIHDLEEERSRLEAEVEILKEAWGQHRGGVVQITTR